MDPPSIPKMVADLNLFGLNDKEVLDGTLQEPGAWILDTLNTIPLVETGLVRSSNVQGQPQYGQPQHMEKGRGKPRTNAVYGRDLPAPHWVEWGQCPLLSPYGERFLKTSQCSEAAPSKTSGFLLESGAHQPPTHRDSASRWSPQTEAGHASARLCSTALPFRPSERKFPRKSSLPLGWASGDENRIITKLFGLSVGRGSLAHTEHINIPHRKGPQHLAPPSWVQSSHLKCGPRPVASPTRRGSKKKIPGFLGRAWKFTHNPASRRWLWAIFGGSQIRIKAKISMELSNHWPHYLFDNRFWQILLVGTSPDVRLLLTSLICAHSGFKPY